MHTAHAVSGPAATFPLAGLRVRGAALRVTARGGSWRGVCVRVDVRMIQAQHPSQFGVKKMSEAGRQGQDSKGIDSGREQLAES